jgi:CBS domain-containing protein
MGQAKGNFIKDIMTKNVQALSRQANLREVASLMKEWQIGDVIVTDEAGKLFGIVTDRDLVVRVIAEGRDPQKVSAGEICSQSDLVTLDTDATIEDAVELMRDKAIRRIPVVKSGAPVGIVSIGDLAQAKDPQSALGKISGAPPSA